MNEVTTALLALSFGAVLVAAVPAALRSLGYGSPPAASTASAVRLRQTAPLPGVERAALEPDDEDEEVDDLQRLYPEPGNWPAIPHGALGGAGRAGDDARRGAAGEKAASGARADAKVGLTRKRLIVMESPSAAAGVLGELGEGEDVRIMSESGDWVLVVHPKDALMGWTRKSGIAIR